MAAHIASKDREPLSGLVERVTFHSPETGFCVLRVKVRGHRELVTVLGSAQPEVILSTRLGPRPSSFLNRSGALSMTSKTSSPNALTSFLAK